jgi:4'-phosphopantetheinyl transferase
MRLGLDLVQVEPLGEPFAREAFAEGELAAWQARLGDPGAPSDRTVATAFAAKEAALKWLGCGLRLPLGAVSVAPLAGAGPWRRRGGHEMAAAVRWEGRTAVLEGWCWSGGDFVWVALWSAEGPYQPSRSR